LGAVFDFLVVVVALFGHQDLYFALSEILMDPV